MTELKSDVTKSRSVIGSIIQNDLRQIFRDKMLLFVLIFPLIFMLLGRWLILNVLRPNILYAGYEILIVGITYALMPLLGAFVFGFICFEEKDEHLFDVIRTRPFPPLLFLGLRIALITGFIFMMNLFIPYLYDISYLSNGESFGLSLVSSTGTTIIGLIIAAYASNKVEGMAWFKICGFIAMIPLVSTMVTSDWTYAFGVLFTFWPIRIVIALATGNQDSLVGLWIGAVFVHLIYIGLAFIIFQKKIFT